VILFLGKKSNNQLYNRWFFTDSFHELCWFFEVLKITKNLWFFDSDFPFLKNGAGISLILKQFNTREPAIINKIKYPSKSPLPPHPQHWS
jgi:hypothetical protein